MAARLLPGRMELQTKGVFALALVGPVGMGGGGYGCPLFFPDSPGALGELSLQINNFRGAL